MYESKDTLMVLVSIVWDEWDELGRGDTRSLSLFGAVHAERWFLVFRCIVTKKKVVKKSTRKQIIKKFVVLGAFDV